MGWFSFLISHGAKPYQRVLTGAPGSIQGLNFKGRRNQFAKKSDIQSYYFDSTGNFYRDGVSEFVCDVNKKTESAVINRLQRVARHIFIDEFQDLVGYDLDVVELLFRSSVNITVVGDPRQYTLSTNLGSRNKKYRGSGILDWLNERMALCRLQNQEYNFRCNQEICDFADKIFPNFPATVSKQDVKTGHDGIIEIPEDEAVAYYEKYQPVVLRDSRKTLTSGLQAMNIGLAKGSTFDRVMIFPTRPMLEFLTNRNSSKLRAPERLYVAVTRARYSVAFVIPSKKSRSKRRTSLPKIISGESNAPAKTVRE